MFEALMSCAVIASDAVFVKTEGAGAAASPPRERVKHSSPPIIQAELEAQGNQTEVGLIKFFQHFQDIEQIRSQQPLFFIKDEGLSRI